MSYNMKRFIGLFLYSLLIILALYFGSIIQKKLSILVSTTFKYHYANIGFTVLFPVFIGLLIGLPNFIFIIKQDGLLKFDWIRLLAIGIPASYITFFPFLYYSLMGKFIPNFLRVFYLNMSSKTMPPYSIGGVVFGYLILSTFYKEDLTA